MNPHRVSRSSPATPAPASIVEAERGGLLSSDRFHILSFDDLRTYSYKKRYARCSPTHAKLAHHVFLLRPSYRFP